MPYSRHKMKKRQVEHLNDIKKKIYIFCEGKKTEPNYFEGFKKAIMCNVVYRNLLYICVEGVGAGTMKVMETAEKFVSENCLKNADIWCVYDKDNFPSQDFNQVSSRANFLNNQRRVSDNGICYNVAWSNQCIEYWFLLHFTFYDADNDRSRYIEVLNNKFRELGLTRYEKNNTELFEIMTERGNPKRAIDWAEKRLNACSGLTDSDSVPATKVHLLVKSLAQYLPDELQKKYL